MYGSCDVTSSSNLSVLTKMSEDKGLKGTEVLHSKVVSDTDSNDAVVPRELEKAPWWSIFWVTLASHSLSIEAH
jgi:hypothetical protein